MADGVQLPQGPASTEPGWLDRLKSWLSNLGKGPSPADMYRQMFGAPPPADMSPEQIAQKVLIAQQAGKTRTGTGAGDRALKYSE